MWQFFLLFPPVIAVVWMVRQMHGFKSRERKWLVVAIVVSLAFYFAIEGFLNQTGAYPFPGAQLLHDLSATMLVPMAYLLFSFSIGIQKSVRYFKLLLLLTLPMVLDVAATIFDIVNGTEGAIDSTHSYIHLEVAKGWSLDMQLFSLIVVVQTLVVATRVQSMRLLLTSRNLYFTRRGVIATRATMAVCVWIVLSLLPPHAALVGNHLLDVFMGVYSLIVVGIIVMLTKYINADIIVDSEQNVVSVEDDVDSVLAESIRLLIENDKVYLNSNLRIEDLASMISSNRTYVSRVCRLKFGKTFTELMNHYRVEEAKELLVRNRSMRMDYVAADCGFSSASFFARVFKANVGMTPTQWRMLKSAEMKAELVKKSDEAAVDGEGA